MPFKPSIDELVVETTSQRTRRKAALPVWEDTIAKLQDNLKVSYENAIGRWGDPANKNFEGNPFPEEQKKPSKNWNVLQMDGVNPRDDICYMFVKIGSKLFPAFPDGKTKWHCSGHEVAGLCKELEGWVDSLEKDSEDGKAIHEASIKVKTVRAKKKYNPETDKFDL